MPRLRRKSKPESKTGPVSLYQRRFWRRPLFLTLAFLAFLLLIGGIIGWHLFTAPFREKANSFDLAKINEVEKTSVVYDRNGDEIGQIYVEDRRPADIEEVPWEFIQALVATEDSRYFHHEGFDPTGFARAMLRNLRAKVMGRSGRQGASTITQQLARNAFDLTREKTVSRKITEIYLARRIEEHYSKTEILQFYLNRIYFGSGFHGANTAALGYFGKPISELTLDESAILVGIIKLPHTLSPLRNPDRSIKARNYVLGRMMKEGMISENEHTELVARPIVTSPSERKIGYAQETVRQQVLTLLKEKPGISMSGLRIETTLDGGLQSAAEESLRRRLAETETTNGYPHPTYAEHQTLLEEYKARQRAGTLSPEEPVPSPKYLQGSLLAIDNRSGEVLAMVGGRDFGDTQFNRTTARRPIGTVFTPFVYGASFEKQIAFPGTLLDDAPIDNRRVMVGGFTGILGEWGSEAAGNTYLRQIPARTSLVLGKNAATVRLGEKLGLEPLGDFASRAGIKAEMKYPSAYLGSIEASLTDLTRAYTTFPSGGRRPEQVHFIRRIEDEKGQTIYRAEPTTVEVTDPVTAYQVHSCLQDVLTDGTASRASAYGYRGFPAGGKTGTHYGFTDLWFLGYTSRVTCGVWIGFDKPQTIYEGAFSNRIALPVWADVMNEAQDRLPGAAIAAPVKGIRFLDVCSRSGLRATDACYDAHTDAEGVTRFVSTAQSEPIPEGFEYDHFCEFHGGSEAPKAALTQLLKPEREREEPAPDPESTFAKVDPVRIKAPTLLGDDPYGSVLPLLRAQVVPNGSNSALPVAPKAKPLEAGYGRKEKRVKVAPPKPLEIN